MTAQHGHMNQWVELGLDRVGELDGDGLDAEYGLLVLCMRELVWV